ncbi:MAG: sulfite exporter TauE/SafE family protein [Candidatus Izemoplasmataceae bacterium]
MTLEVTLIIGTIILFSSFIKGVTGFGTALFAMPLITLFYLTPLEARPLIVTINLALNIFILLKEKKLNKASIAPIKTLFLSGFIAAILSGFVLSSMNDFLFNLLLGTLLIFTSINKLFNLNFVIRAYERFYLLIGSLGGLLNTLIGAGGVPVLIYLSNTELKKDHFRISILLYFFAMNIGSLLAFLINDTYSIDIFYTSLSIIPFALIGGFVGLRTIPLINNQLFGRIVSVLLLLMGVNSLLSIL